MKIINKLSSTIFIALALSACQSEEAQIKEAFLLVCNQNQSIATLSSLYGKDRIEPVCTCAFSETKKTVTLEEMKKVMSGRAGILESEYQKFPIAMIESITICIKQLKR